LTQLLEQLPLLLFVAALDEDLIEFGRLVSGFALGWPLWLRGLFAVRHSDEID
jgi:hypothetical protein